jgi:hypothetical protein
MEYLILINADESTMPGPGDAGFDEMMNAFFAYSQKLIDGGHWVSGASLQPSSTATTLRREAGTPPTITDGPFAETKEQLGGFYLISAENLDEALALARELPIQVGAIEVRPVAIIPDAG